MEIKKVPVQTIYAPYARQNPAGTCPYICNLKNSYGYCQLTACTNPEHNGSGIYIVGTSYDEYKMATDPDYGLGIYS